jgi:hypothetical protein
MKQLLSVSSAGLMLSKHILSIELSFSLCLHLGLAFCLPGLCGRSMAPLSPLPPFQVPLPLPLLLPLSPVPVRDRLPANVLVVLCACRSVGNKLSPTSHKSSPSSATVSDVRVLPRRPAHDITYRLEPIMMTESGPSHCRGQRGTATVTARVQTESRGSKIRLSDRFQVKLELGNLKKHRRQSRCQ